MATTADDAIRDLIGSVMQSEGEERERIIQKHKATLRSEHIMQIVKKRVDELTRNVRNLEKVLAEVRRMTASNEEGDEEAAGHDANKEEGSGEAEADDAAGEEVNP